MIFRIGIENNNEGRTIAWALEHPGCFAYGRNSEEAQVNFKQAAQDYVAWVASHGGLWLEDNIQVVLEETYNVYFITPHFELARQGENSYMIESVFVHDWKPLKRQEIERAIDMLAWSRADLLSLVAGLSSETLEQGYPNERWSIGGILNHIGSGEWFYQECIGYPSPENEEDLPSDPFQRLADVREHFNSLLPGLDGMDQVVGREGEIWSPRKVLRRALWHERDHTEHIRKLLKR